VKQADGSAYYDAIARGTRGIVTLDDACGARKGTPAWTDQVVPEEEILRSEQTEVLVVGAGIGGVCAALSASDEGAQVLLLEKMSRPRGCFEGLAAIGSCFQRESGIRIDKPKVMDELYCAAEYRVTPHAVRVWADHSGAAVDWLLSTLSKEDDSYTLVDWSFASDTLVGIWSKPFPLDVDDLPGCAGRYVGRDLNAIAKKRTNIDVRYSSAAVQLVPTESGSIGGVIARDKEGYFRVTATRGVVLATGGSQSTPDMLKAYCRSEDGAAPVWWPAPKGSTGDGHMMGLQVGAAMDCTPHAVMHQSFGSPASIHSAPFWQPLAMGVLGWHGRPPPPGRR